MMSDSLVKMYDLTEISGYRRQAEIAEHQRNHEEARKAALTDGAEKLNNYSDSIRR